MKKNELEKQIIELLDKISTEENMIVILSNNMPGYSLEGEKNIDVDIIKNDGTYLISIENLYFSDNYWNHPHYLVPVFSIGVLNNETRLKHKITCALYEEQLEWLLDQLLKHNYDVC